MRGIVVVVPIEAVSRVGSSRDQFYSNRRSHSGILGVLLLHRKRCELVVCGRRWKPNAGDWEEFEGAIQNEFILFDGMQRSRDKLRGLFQRTSVSKYLSEFKNIVLMNPEVNQGEQLDCFCQGLKPHTRLEVLMYGARTIDESAMIAQGHPCFGSRSCRPIVTPTEVGNMERQRNRFGRVSDRGHGL